MARAAALKQGKKIFDRMNRMYRMSDAENGLPGAPALPPSILFILFILSKSFSLCCLIVSLSSRSGRSSIVLEKAGT
jgi:hypothetical protein